MMEILDDAYTAARQSFTERLSSPIISSFLVAWLGWNWKFVMVVASANTVTTTIDLIDKIAFPNPWSICFRGIVLPLMSAAAYLFLYPYPSRWVFDTP